jgi:hypothetical protein
VHAGWPPGSVAPGRARRWLTAQHACSNALGGLGGKEAGLAGKATHRAAGPEMVCRPARDREATTRGLRARGGSAGHGVTRCRHPRAAVSAPLPRAARPTLSASASASTWVDAPAGGCAGRPCVLFSPLGSAGSIHIPSIHQKLLLLPRRREFDHSPRLFPTRTTVSMADPDARWHQSCMRACARVGPSHPHCTLVASSFLQKIVRAPPARSKLYGTPVTVPYFTTGLA